MAKTKWPIDPVKPRTESHAVHINTLRLGTNGCHVTDNIFKCIFLDENIWIPIKFSLKFVPKGPIDNIPALDQIMAWRRPGDKPLSEPMMVVLPTHICITRPQWVKLSYIKISQSFDVERFVFWNCPITLKLDRCKHLLNFKAIQLVKPPMFWLENFTKSLGKTSYKISKLVPRGCCHIGYPSEIHLKLKSCENSFTHKLLLICQIASKFCTEHGSITSMPNENIQNHLTFEMDALVAWDFARFDFKMSLGQVFVGSVYCSINQQQNFAYIKANCKPRAEISFFPTLAIDLLCAISYHIGHCYYNQTFSN